MNDPNNPNLYVYCRNNPLIYTDPSGNLSLKEIVNFFKSMFGIKGEKKSDKKDDKKDKSDSNKNQTNGDTTTDTTQYHGEQPSGDPVGYQEFPGPPPVKFPIYKLDQLPESERAKYKDLVNPDDDTIMFIPPGMENAKISEHFTISEFMADVAKKDPSRVSDTNPEGFVIENNRVVKDGKERFIRLDPKLIQDLEMIRAANGNNAMIITDGYRTAEYNKALRMVNPDAASKTPHSAGIAADFIIVGVNAKTVQSNIFALGIGRVGQGANTTHYDIGYSGAQKTWTYSKESGF